MDGGAASGHKSGAGTSSHFSGGSAHAIVQGRDITGGVHFHVGQTPVPVPQQLPGDVRGFVNRTTDLERLDAELDLDGDGAGSVPVRVIAGTAGVGKTSLAVYWAHRAKEHFPDGQLYVNLRGYDPGAPLNPAQALERFLVALGVPAGVVPTDLEARAAMYRTLLADKKILIVLDNAATVGQVRPLLPGAGRCLTLITSRSRLSGLVARNGAQRMTLEVFEESAAVELLHGTTAGYRIDDDQEVLELARLCARLPLALRVAAERAAARPRVPLGMLIEDLRDESSLWDALSSEDDDEADAVRTVFAWSYRALSAEAARLFRLLGLNPSPEFSAHAAAAIGASPLNQARRLLDALVGAHLLEQIGPDRYQFHDLLRAYATDQTRRLDTAEDRHVALQRVLTWYLHTADALAEADRRRGFRRVALGLPGDDVRPLQFTTFREAMDWFRTEQSNLLAAVRGAADAGLDRMAWQLPAVLRSIYASNNLFEDWFTAGRLGLEAARRCDDQEGQAVLLEILGMACRQSHQLNEAVNYYQAALQIRRKARDRYGEAWLLNLLGTVYFDGHKVNDAYVHLKQSVDLCRDLGYAELISDPTTNLCAISRQLGRLDEAIGLGRRALAAYREAGDRYGEADALGVLCEAHLELGQLDLAASLAEESLAIAHELDNRLLEGWVLIRRGKIQHACGEIDQALVSYHRSATIHRRVGDRSREAEVLDATGTAYQALGREEEAVAFHRQSVAIHRDLGDRWNTAVALNHLATELREAGAIEQTRSSWQEALPLLAEFNDPKSRALRISIEAALSELHSASTPLD
ncbi:tetratricopeptide repeat protein [Streptomyces sp. NPDC056244]|uniref:ATP-binding protein n=1 Tax=Streptomyces sp. NPDC056244 TaxID=3345762 RepID=UPI0035DEBCA3